MSEIIKRIASLSIILMLVTGSVFINLIYNSGKILFISGDDREELVAVPDNSSIEIIFNNSVTGGRVSILIETINSSFYVVGVFTDQATSEYYTSGFYDLNESARRNNLREIIFCSDTGFRVIIHMREYYRIISTKDSIEFLIESGCLHLIPLKTPLAKS